MLAAHFQRTLAGELEFVAELRGELGRLQAEYEELAAANAASLRGERRRSQATLLHSLSIP